jgi:hypothetical protein
MEVAEAPTDREEIFGKARRLLLNFTDKSVEFFLLLPLNLRENIMEGIAAPGQLRRCKVKQRD